MKYLKSIMLLLLLLPTVVKSQDLVQGELGMETIKPLDELMQLAIGNMAALNTLTTSQEIYREETQITQKKWLQHLAFTAGVNYGNGIVSDQLTDGTTSNRLTYLSRQNVTYNVGLNLRLPFTEVSSRKHEIKIKQLEIERLEGLKNERKEFIRGEVLRFYKDLKSSLQSMELQSEVVQANEMALEVAENYFKAGKLAMEQYRMAIDSHYTSRLQLEKSKNEAWYCLRSLKELVGQSILK